MFRDDDNIKKVLTLPILRFEDKKNKDHGPQMCGSGVLVDSGGCGLFLITTTHVFDDLNICYYTIIDEMLVPLTGETFFSNPEQRDIFDIDFDICLINLSGDLADQLAMNYMVFPYQASEEDIAEDLIQDIFIQGNPGNLHQHVDDVPVMHFSAFRYHTSKVNSKVYRRYDLDPHSFLVLNYRRYSSSSQGKIRNPNPLDLCGSGIWKKCSDGEPVLLGIVTNSADDFLIGTSIHLFHHYIKDYKRYYQSRSFGEECFN